MSKIRNILKIDTKAEMSLLKTTDKLLIVDNKVVMTDTVVGDIVWNLALIFDDYDSNVIIKEVTCVNVDNIIYFERNDDVENKYCMFTYLSIKE